MFLALLFACTGSPTVVEVSAPDPEPVVVPSPSSGHRARVDPLDGKSLHEICLDPSLALIKWDFEDLHDDFRGLCCLGGPGVLPEDHSECDLDWPFSDLPPCSEWDVMRNGVMARYGYPFSKPDWQKRFEGKDWYERREDFDGDWLSGPAKRNVQKMKQFKKDRYLCGP